MSLAAPSSLLSDETLGALASEGTLKRYPTHTILINEGDSADALYVIVSGRVKVYCSDEEGKEIVINTHSAGEYVGELALDGGIRSTSVMTLEPTVCSVVPGTRLRELIATHPEFAVHLIHKLIRRVRHATDTLKTFALKNVYGRIRWLLLKLSEPEGQVRVVRERLTQQDIAERIGSSREMVSRVFKELTVGGYVDVIGGRIRILKGLPENF